MPVATLTSLNVNFAGFNASVPPTSNADRPERPMEKQDEDKPRFRENTLVSAMMAAFQALGIGQAAAATTTTGSTTLPPSGIPQAATKDSVTGTTSATPSTTGTTGTAPASAPAPDTLEKAVNEFAHALSFALRRQGGGGHSDGQHDGEHAHGHEGHGSGGYNGLVQRLEQLAQSLGGTAPVNPSNTPPASGATASSSGSPSDQTGAVTVSASGTSAPSADPASPTLSRPLARLLTAFTNLLSFLQPTTTATAAPATASPAAPADTPVSSASVTDKLRQFLTTLAQSLNTGAHLSPVGSRVNYSV